MTLHTYTTTCIYKFWWKNRYIYNEWNL